MGMVLDSRVALYKARMTLSASSSQPSSSRDSDLRRQWCAANATAQGTTKGEWK